jgi:chemotaxis protein CheD
VKNPPHLSLVERRIRGESMHDFYTLAKRIRYAQSGLTHVKLFAGDCYVTNKTDEVLMTILGSCVAVCAHDHTAKISGMNHFLLPGEETADLMHSESARYGVHAMERLINAMLAAGARKERLEIKVFGGGNVTRNSNAIGTKNSVFIREFLAREGYEIAAHDLEGNQPRRVHFYSETGRVMLRKLQRRDDALLVEEELRACTKMRSKTDGEINLF